MTKQEQAVERPATRPESTSDLTDYTGFLLRRAYVRARACVEESIPPPYGVRDAIILTLLHAGGPASQQRLVELTGINRTIMVKLIDELEERGLVRRERNLEDRRSYALVLTDTGQAALGALRPAIAAAERLLTANLDRGERGRLRELLRSVLPTRWDDVTGAFGDRTGSLINPAHRYLRQRAFDVLAPLGLEPRSFAALLILQTRAPCSQQAIATAMRVGAPVVLPLVEDLERAGLVRRERNPHDRRAYLLTVTAAGQDRIDAARGALQSIHTELADRLGRGGDDDLRRLLNKLVGPDQELRNAEC